MSTLTVMNYSQEPPQVVGWIRMKANGAVTWDASLGFYNLERGVLETSEHVMPTDGPRFMEAVLRLYGRSTYIRAIEGEGPKDASLCGLVF